ncbi:2-oxo acid dehydrogenase subunit E2 [Streptacidiphilus griseoplanus]|uniref:2-oxo acid dehydrogenase subunit E2 n=1 Tax=Peterkaempfera griseoplana TaxID=66896 RepID=UPI0006E1F98F|nr:2-oxo acid dehydrogenase subunit E2 [Peterkaempfera griseoplana]
MSDITMPRLNSNDADYTLVEWVVGDGAEVAAGDTLAVIETSKAVSDLEAAEDGVLQTRVAAGQRCAPGVVIGRLLSAEEYADAGRAVEAGKSRAEADTSAVVVTGPARRLMELHGVSEEQVRALGRQLVQRSDVEALVAEAAEAAEVTEVTEVTEAAEVVPLSAVQCAVAANVAVSHREIPAAFTVMKVYSDALLAARDAAAERDGTFLGVTEFLVGAVARRHAEFPLFFSRLVDGESVVLSDRARVGVTVDVGRGLYLPVVRDAETLSLAEIASVLMGFRVKAMRGRFEPEDLDASNIAVTLHTEPDLVQAMPIIFPGHVCALSLCSVQQEVQLLPDGAVHQRSFFNLGVSYDHRVVNGWDAARFLRAVKEELEIAPEQTGTGRQQNRSERRVRTYDKQ